MAIPTPYSYRQYTGDGTAKTFSIPFPYLARAHVHLYLDNKELKDGTDFTWTSGTQVQLTVAPQAPVAGTTPKAAEVLTVRRQTPEDDQLVQWKDGSYIIQADLNESDRQWLYLIQEHHDALMLLITGSGSIPGGGNPSVSLAFWNNLPRNKDPNKGTATELAQTIQKLDQLLGNWPKDGKDKFIATTDAISARLDPYVQDGAPPALGLPQKEQNGKTWFDTDDLVQRFWDADAGAWVTLANTGPPGPPGVVAVGATVTLPPGSSAAVTSSVTPSGAVLDFKIPRGDVGPTGLTGLTGPMGPAGPAGVAPVLPAATGTTLGGIKVGSNLDIDTSGVLSAKLPGALIYRGTLAATAAPPASPVSGDVYVLSSAGILTGAGWGAIAGLSVNTGDMLLYTGTAWDHVGSTGGVGGAGVTAVKVAAPITKAGTAAEPLIGVADATAATKGVVQLADAAAITAGTAGRVVDAAQLKAAASAIDGGFANSNYGSAPAAIDGGTATTP